MAALERKVRAHQSAAWKGHPRRAWESSKVAASRLKTCPSGQFQFSISINNLARNRSTRSKNSILRSLCAPTMISLPWAILKKCELYHVPDLFLVSRSAHAHFDQSLETANHRLRITRQPCWRDGRAEGDADARLLFVQQFAEDGGVSKLVAHHGECIVEPGIPTRDP